MKSNSRVPMRRCIGCMQSFPQRELFRIVFDGEHLIFDQDGNKAGRGSYLCKKEQCIEKVRRNRGFNRSYRRNFSSEETDKLLDEILLTIRR